VSTALYLDIVWHLTDRVACTFSTSPDDGHSSKDVEFDVLQAEDVTKELIVRLKLKCEIIF
jgi:hypothetical protein